MKNVFTSLIVIGFLAVTPLFVNAHMMGSSLGADNPVSAEEFEEMQDVMIKMMNDEVLTQEEVEEMSEFMAEHHQAWDGPYFYGNQMRSNANWMPGYGMHMFNGFGGGSFMYWASLLTMFVWLFVGVLLGVVLIRKINKS